MDSYVTGVTSDSLFIDDILNSKNSTDGEVLYYLPSSAFHMRSILKTTPYQKAIQNYSVAVKRLTHVSDNLTVTPGDTIRMDIVGNCPLQGAIWTINEAGVTAINNGEELTADMYGDTLWQESGYTMTIPEGVVYIWINLHKTDDTAIKQRDLEYVKIVKV